MSRSLCLEPPCGCISMASIVVAAERRHNLIRRILCVGGEERDRCLLVVAAGVVPAGRRLHEWDLWMETSGEQHSACLGGGRRLGQESRPGQGAFVLHYCDLCFSSCLCLLPHQVGLICFGHPAGLGGTGQRWRGGGRETAVNPDQ